MTAAVTNSVVLVCSKDIQLQQLPPKYLITLKRKIIHIISYSLYSLPGSALISVELAILDISYEWDLVTCGYWCLASLSIMLFRCTCVQVHVRAWVLFLKSHSVGETGFQWDLRLTAEARVVASKLQGSFYLCLSNAGVVGMCHQAQLFVGTAMELRSSCLHSKHFTLLGPLFPLVMCEMYMFMCAWRLEVDGSCLYPSPSFFPFQKGTLVLWFSYTGWPASS